MSEYETLTGTAVLAEALRLLERGGYVVKRDGLDKLGLPQDRCFIAEDVYGVALVAGYESWAEAEAGWEILQDSFVDALSTRISKANPKAWDAYLVLLVPGELTASQERGVGRIRQDTSRARKLVAAGTELRTLADVERAVLPLLPIDPQPGPDDYGDPLSALPRLLAPRIAPDAVNMVLAAFRENKPILEELDQHLRTK